MKWELFLGIISIKAAIDFGQSAIGLGQSAYFDELSALHWLKKKGFRISEALLFADI